MTFTEQFPSFVCEGDSIDCTVQGFDINARIHRDDCADNPDQRQDGFWPSLDLNVAGYIGDGPEPQKRLAAEQVKAFAIMNSWQADEWFYCGIVLSVSRAGVLLETHAAGLWSIAANYPDSDNTYLGTVANELLAEAVKAGQDAFARLMATSPLKRADDILFRKFHGNEAGWIGGVNNAPLVGQDGHTFSAIFDEDASPVIIERRTIGEDGSHQVMPSDPNFEEIYTRLVRLWDAVSLGAA